MTEEIDLGGVGPAGGWTAAFTRQSRLLLPIHVDYELAQAKEVHALTYTCNFAYARKFHLTKLICSRWSGKPIPGTRCLRNNHCKIYFVIRDSKPTKAFLGSWNLTEPTLLDIMVSLPELATSELHKHYLSLYAQAKPCSS